jgi:hypothetical protein
MILYLKKDKTACDMLLYLYDENIKLNKKKLHFR